ncbi:GNAT family N-acetyltransferase [Ferruginibacter albus]|uniref:GNAT family N-acetyltransferase n=1 Tax=Ferruginibacter albus TaxID=2875540 RepID=UPI001CC387F9|nr:GNAT family N-acetyltransferase [Ferruginibacter albus]UAY51729.1 GNAT family N-acetyltransferase [Ferruginibacter albus]
MADTTFHTITSFDKALIEKIADWYFEEWKIPKERTIHRLQHQSGDDVLFQLVLFIDNIPVATGGLYNNVGLHQSFPHYKKLQPWIALLYTSSDHRNKGYGRLLLREIESTSSKKGFVDLYLYTFTAEELYLKEGWKELSRVNYHNNQTVIMQKQIKTLNSL